MTSWKASAGQYLAPLEAAEVARSMPTDLLVRVAYQESHFREDIISGQVKSPAGCVGLMQLNPVDFPGAGQDWRQDILTAADYLVRLYAEHEDWQLAVAAYNWGPGNLRKFLLGKATMPKETTDYITEVFTDVPVAGSLFNTDTQEFYA